MRGVIHGWRRNLGIVTLILSCLLTLGYLRSFAVDDFFSIKAGRQVVGSNHYFKLWSLVSAEGRIYFGLVWTRCPDPKAFHSEEELYRFPRWFTSYAADFPSGEYQYYWQICGFGVYERSPNDQDNGGWRLMLPYWSATLPLILMSAYLVLKQITDTQLGRGA